MIQSSVLYFISYFFIVYCPFILGFEHKEINCEVRAGTLMYLTIIILNLYPKIFCILRICAGSNFCFTVVLKFIAHKDLLLMIL